MNNNSVKIIFHFGIAFLIMFFLVGKGKSQKPDYSIPINNKQTSIPRFETSPTCQVQIPDGVKAECGNLFVKENRRKADSRIIKLPIIIIKSTATNPAADPVLYTAGGPGAGSLGRARGAANLVPFTKERDFIIFEQRGTQYAEPNLQCPEVNEAIHKNREQNLNAKEALRKEVQAAKLCRDRLIRQGVDLAAYDSASSAADIEDLRRVLGIRHLNLYGISYSTRLMLNYIREYPENVRSVILDSVLPPTVNWDETGIDGVVNSLELIFEACKRQEKCSTRYPRLKERFFSLVASADKKPIIVAAVKNGKSYPVKINGSAIVDFIYNLLENTRMLPQIPFTLDALSRGNYEFLKAYAENNLTSGGFIWGMRYSVWCREEMPFQSRRKINDQIKKYPELKGFRIQGALPGICKIWNVSPAPPLENQPVKNPTIPALIFSGEFDPDTPPDWGRLVASWFPNSFFYEVKSTSHGAMNSRCTFAEIPSSFLKDPASKPDSACLSDIKPIDFK